MAEGVLGRWLGAVSGSRYRWRAARGAARCGGGQAWADDDDHHAYTADQNLLDGPHNDLRRARAAAVNLVPTSTGAAKALDLVIPEFEGRLHGFAVRVPVPTGSLVDLTVEAQRETSAEEVKAAFRARADAGELEGVLAYSDDPLVSSDIIKSSYSATFDAGLTSVVNGTQVKASPGTTTSGATRAAWWTWRSA